MIQLHKIAHAISNDITREVERQIGNRTAMVNVFERIAKTLEENGSKVPTVGTMWKCWDLEREERIDAVTKFCLKDLEQLIDGELHGYDD